MRTIKEHLDNELEKFGMNDTHELYMVLERIFKLGIMLGSEDVFRVYCNEKRKKYYYIGDDWYIEDEEGVLVSIQELVKQAKELTYQGEPVLD